MAGLPSKARVVVIGAGIVGNSMAWHLARLGWRDIVLLEKGPLPNPGGSTGHASNFIFPTDHNKEMALLTLESQRQYVEHGLNNECGGIEVARSEERLEEFNRRMTSARSLNPGMVTPGMSIAGRINDAEWSAWSGSRLRIFCTVCTAYCISCP